MLPRGCKIATPKGKLLAVVIDLAIAAEVETSKQYPDQLVTQLRGALQVWERGGAVRFIGFRPYSELAAGKAVVLEVNYGRETDTWANVGVDALRSLPLPSGYGTSVSLNAWGRPLQLPSAARATTSAGANTGCMSLT